MPSEIIGLIGVVVLIILVLLGMRVAFAMLVLGLVGIFLFMGWDATSGTAGFIPFASIAQYPYSCLPLFILMGYFAFYGGIVTELMDAARNWVGHIHGGLPVATALGCAGFAACSGSSIASVALMTNIALPDMLRAKVQPRLASGVIAASGTLASLIPPSGLIIIYGIITDQSIGKLLIAGIIPGTVSVLIYIAMIYTRTRLSPKLAPVQTPSPWEKRLSSLRGTWSVLAIFLLIVVGIYQGVFTPTEAAGAGAVFTMIIVILKRRMTWAKFRASLIETGKTTFMLFALIVTVQFFIRFLTLSDLPDWIAATVSNLPVGRYLILSGFLMLYIILGMFMGPASMMMLSVPVILPAVLALGFDGIWFGIIVIKMCEIAMISPPIGLNVFIVHSLSDIRVGEVFKGCMPFLAMDILTVAVLVAFPQIVMVLPNMM